MKSILYAAILAATALAQAQDLGPEFRQFQVAAGFQICIENTVRVALAELKTKQLSSVSATQVEGVVWNTALDACMTQITSDKARGLILLHYQGDLSKAKGFEEGVLWAGRAFVAGTVADSGLGTGATRTPRKSVPQM